MLIEMPALDAAEKVAIIGAEAGRAAEREVRVETFSEETRLMLSVRDMRDRAAFAELFRRFAPRVKGFLMRGGTSEAQSEEVVQEVMLRVWHKSAQFDPHRANVTAWVFTIARNARVDMIRREARPMPEELKEDPGSQPDAGQVVGMEQEAARLRQALAGLKPAQREMIERAYLGELTHQELSDATGLPMGTIKSRIRLGLDRLRHELKGLRE